MLGLIRGKKVLVVGMARSGVAAARLLSAAGAAEVLVTDQKAPQELQKELQTLKKASRVTTFTGSRPDHLVTEELSLIVKSPGVPLELPFIKKAEKLGIALISEIELSYAFMKAPLVGITGTNGKTTVTALTAAMLKEAGFNPVQSAGNIGNPLADLALNFSPQGVVVAELSSFQLNDIKNFRPFVAVFLNFSPDHLDYHGSLEHYFKAKARITENQKEGDYLILNASDVRVLSLAEKTKARVLFFDRGPVEIGAGLKEGWVCLFSPGLTPQKVCPVNELVLPGEHNLENALAASAAAWAAGADPKSIGQVLRLFKALPHRLEHVACLAGVDYINDSKGTNPEATIKALASFPGRSVILLAGGKDKGADFSALARMIKEKVKLLLLYGETRELLAAAAEEAAFKDYQVVSGLPEAVEMARQKAKEGDLVLLSPACASWDSFKDFEERGELFKTLVLSNRAAEKLEEEE